MKLIGKYWVVIVILFAAGMFIKPAVSIMILGSVFIYLGIASIVFQKKLKRKGVSSAGRVVDYETDADGDIIPVVEFTTIEGVVITKKPSLFTSGDLSKFRSYKNIIGKEIRVVYDPGHPENFIIGEDDGCNYIVMTFFIIAGLVFITAAFLSLTRLINIGL